MNVGFFRFLVVLGALGIAGCGTERQSPLALVGGSLKSIVQARQASAPLRPDDLLTRAEIDQVTVPYGIVGIERRGAYVTMTLAGQNRGYNTWVTGDGAGIILFGEILTGTKGLGADLSSADPGTLPRLIETGGGAASRVHNYLDGEGRSYSISYICSVSRSADEVITIIGKTHATRVVTESCVSNQETFENRYWIGQNDGIMWQSQQWVSDEVGHVLLLTLVPVAR